MGIESDGSLPFHSDGWPDLKLQKKTVAVSALSGHYEGQVPFILDMNLIFPGDGTMSFDQNVKVASIEIKCPTEKIAETASGVTFPNIATTGDCMGDALRQQKKDVSKFTIDINSDGSLTFHSDGWPDLKLTKKTVAVAALNGHYEGQVPFILDMNLIFPGDGMGDALRTQKKDVSKFTIDINSD